MSLFITNHSSVHLKPINQVIVVKEDMHSILLIYRMMAFPLIDRVAHIVSSMMICL